MNTHMNTQYTFQDKYILFSVPDITGNLIRWWMRDIDSNLARFCFTTIADDTNGISKELARIDEHIMNYVRETCKANMPAPMVMHTDEAENYTGIRMLQPGRKYEAVHVRHNGHGAAAYSHLVIDLKEYNDADLDEIVHNYGYNDLNAFLKENDAENAILDDMAINRNCQAWLDVAKTLVAFIIEAEDGRIIASKRADKLAAEAGVP